MLICTGDRDSFQLVSDRTTVLYPMRGVSEMERMTPAAVEEKYGVAAGPLPRARRAGRRDLRQPARRPRRRAQDRRQVDQPVRRPRQRHRPRRRDQGQGGRVVARAPRRRDPQPPAQRAGLRPRPAADARPTWRCSRGTARRCTRSSTAWSSGCCATGSSRPWSPRRRSTTAASSSTATRLEPGAGRRLAGRARARRRAAGRRPRRRAPGGAGTGDVHGARAGDRRRRGGLARRRADHPRGRRGARRAGSADPDACPRCCTTPRARCWRSPRAAGRWPASSATPRCRRTSPGPTSAPTTWPT